VITRLSDYVCTDVIGVLLDVDSESISFHKNGKSLGQAFGAAELTKGVIVAVVYLIINYLSTIICCHCCIHDCSTHHSSAHHCSLLLYLLLFLMYQFANCVI